MSSGFTAAPDLLRRQSRGRAGPRHSGGEKAGVRRAARCVGGPAVPEALVVAPVEVRLVHGRDWVSRRSADQLTVTPMLQNPSSRPLRADDAGPAPSFGTSNEGISWCGRLRDLRALGKALWYVRRPFPPLQSPHPIPAESANVADVRFRDDVAGVLVQVFPSRLTLSAEPP